MTAIVPDRRLGDVVMQVVVTSASAWARSLVENLGTPVPVAARVAARRYALDPDAVRHRLPGLRVSPEWFSGDRRRPTSRPTRRANPVIDAGNLPSEARKQERRGAISSRFFGGAP